MSFRCDLPQVVDKSRRFKTRLSQTYLFKFCTLGSISLSQYPVGTREQEQCNVEKEEYDQKDNIGPEGAEEVHEGKDAGEHKVECCLDISP